MTMRTRIVPFGVALAMAVGSRQAAAQLGEVDSRPTQGAFIPGAALAGDADATAVELNPGQLGLVAAPSLVLTGNWWTDATPIPGRGGGVLLAQPVFANLYLGAAVQGVRQPAQASGLGTELGYGKLNLAAAFRVGRSFSLGLGWGHIFGSVYDGLDTFDVGLGWRLWSWLALGGVVHDVGEPVVRAGSPLSMPRSLSRIWELELALRPLGTSRLELAMAARVSEREGWSAWAPRFRGFVTVAPGWRVFGEATFAPIDGHDAFSNHGEVRGSLGLAIDFDHVGIAAAAVASRTSETVGGAGLLRISGERSPSALPLQHVERVGLGGVDDDRAFLGVLVRLREAVNDPSVAAVLLETEGMDLGMARVEELRAAVSLLRRSGKRVFAYLQTPRTREVMLAAACDRIALHPAGDLDLRGLSQTTLYYKGLFDRLGIRFDLVRVGQFKGAAEPLVRTGPSEPVQENRDQLLDAGYARLVAAVAEGRAARGLDAARVRTFIERGMFTPPAALQAGLVDALKDELEVDNWVRLELGRSDVDVEAPDLSPRRAWSWRPSRVAVVLVDGTIFEGSSKQLPFDAGGLVGADTVVDALDEVRRDASVRAVVIRVNSPGGSAFASDQIARAVVGLRQAGKPVVVSMGDTAASGGYYIAAPGNAILVSPSTLTGSIGVFAYKADGHELLTRLGLNVITTRRGPHSDADSLLRAWSPEEMSLVQDEIQHAYSRFLDVIEHGRKSRGLERARIDELGRGHVWSGEEAVALKLADGVGGVMDAVALAAELGRVRPGPMGVPPLQVLPRPPVGLLQKLASSVAAWSTTDETTGVLDQRSAPVQPLLAGLPVPAIGRAAIRLLAPILYGRSEGVLARLPFELDDR